jgi:Co/Zn/Cd efflux system component
MSISQAVTLGTQPAGGQCATSDLEVKEHGERGALTVLLVLNLLLMVVEATLGWKAESTALLADAADNLADAAVYAVAVYAIGRSHEMKMRAARLGGICQAGLALAVIGDIIRRSLSNNEPNSWIIIGVGIGALAVNICCLVLITRYRRGGVHMKASYIISENDVIANTATVITGIIILLTGEKWLDLVVGGCIVMLVLYGSVMIFREMSRSEIDHTNNATQLELVLPGSQNAQPCGAAESPCGVVAITVQYRDGIRFVSEV